MTTQHAMYIFCTKCGSGLEDHGHYKVCVSCGKHYYFNAKPTVTIILSDAEGKLLITKRNREPYKDWWDLPGGFVEEGETLEQAAQRELKEETGVEVSTFSYVGSFKQDYQFQDEIIPVVAAVFTCTLSQEVSVVVGDDVSDHKFVAKQDLKFEEIAFENQRAFVKNYLK